MSRNIKVIVVDVKFFNNVFEKQRKQLQKKLGVINLSQPKFTKMIMGLEMIELNKKVSKFKKGRKRRINDF